MLSVRFRPGAPDNSAPVTLNRGPKYQELPISLYAPPDYLVAFMDSNKNTRIRERAYELYLHRGCSDGDDLRDWLKAEEEMREEEYGHRGPARMAHAHRGKLAHDDGCDIENPT
jgi:hypothetical protein